MDDGVSIGQCLDQVVPAAQQAHLVRQLCQTAGKDATDMPARTRDRYRAAEKRARPDTSWLLSDPILVGILSPFHQLATVTGFPGDTTAACPHLLKWPCRSLERHDDARRSPSQ
jgi:hypothetical protein